MRPKAVALLLMLVLAALLAPGAECAADASARFDALIRTYTDVLLRGRQASAADVTAWREIVLQPTVETAAFAQRVALDSHRSLDERVVAVYSMAMLPEEARTAFASPIVEAFANGRLPTAPSGFQAYSLLEAALLPSGLRAFKTPAGRALLAKARGIDGLDPRLAWTIDSARGAPHPQMDDAAFGRLLEAIARIAPKIDKHDLTRVVAFRDIARDPAPYRDLATRAVRNDTLSIDARVVAVLAMQRLPEADLFEFLDAVTQATLDGAVPKTPSKIFSRKSILAAALFPQSPYAYPCAKMFSRDPRALALVAKAKGVGDPTAFELEIAAGSQAMLSDGPAYDAYVDVLKPVAAHLGRADWYDGAVFGDAAFLAIFECAEPYRALAERAMRDPALDRDVRIVAALTIQRLPQDMLLDVLDRLVADASAGRLDMRRGQVEPDTILEAALFPHVNFNAYLRLAPTAPRVRRLLFVARGIDGLTDTLKRQIADAVSGKSRTELLDAYGAVDPIPRLDYVREGREASIEVEPLR